MALKNPTPPTPPTPPVIDKGDGANNHAVIDAKHLLGIRKADDSATDEEFTDVENTESEENPPAEINRQVTTPETMARDAVAKGGGALTKKTVEKPAEKPQDNPQTNQQVSPKVPGLNFAMTEDDRGKQVLKEFQQEDKNNSEQKTVTESPRIVKLGSHEDHGGFYWAIILIFAAVLGFFFVRKFLVTDKPKLKKSDLYTSSSEKLKNVAEKVNKPVVKLPPKKDDDKGKHFEVRV